jgi:Domain of unknown function (DUF4760)
MDDHGTFALGEFTWNWFVISSGEPESGGFWEHVAKFAPIVTAAIALVAASIAFFAARTAWRSLQTQKSLALKKSAIDFFLKVEMDKSMLDDYSAYKRGLSELAKQDKNNTSAEYDLNFWRESDPVCYDAITRYLDVIELMATAIKSGAFDEEVCFGLWSRVLSEAVKNAKPVIDNERINPELRTYDDLLELERDWRARLPNSK